jgi:hypothetical protein
MLVSGNGLGVRCCMHSQHTDDVKKLPTEAEIHARLRELTEAARRLRAELEEPRKSSSTPKLRGMVNDGPGRASRKKR